MCEIKHTSYSQKLPQNNSFYTVSENLSIISLLGCCYVAQVVQPDCKICLLSIRTSTTCRTKSAAVQSVQRKWTCHHVDIPAIRGTFSGAVAGSLQCLLGSIIRLAPHSLKMSYIHSNEL